MRYGSVCSGIEAATMAWHSLGWIPTFFSEIDKFPSAVLAHHYGSNMPGEPLAKNGIPNYGDFTQIGTEAGPIDLLVGGTPCQSFSVAGRRLGLDDPRGNLALEYLSLARRLRARWIVWENVPGVLSSYSGAEQASREVQEGPVGGEGNGIEDRDFAMFLSFVRECGYGFAYRVLDAQYVRVDGHARAVPQRRERVFLVGYLGDWRPAAAVLLEPEGMRGDSAPSRKAGERVAGTVTGGAHPGGFNGQDAYNDKLIAHSLRADGFDASEDGTGRGTPIVPVIAVAHVLPFDTTQVTSKANRSVPKVGDPSHPLAAGAHAPAIAFNWQQGGDHSTSLALEVERPPTLQRSQSLAVQQEWAVRRLTPRECERLQGFPDDFTAVPYRGKPAADGPRYKALGNSMACNAMRWIGRRIDIIEKLIKAGRIAA